MENAERISGLRRRKNGEYEYRFSEAGKRYSVYGKSIEDCLRKRSEKILRLRTFDHSGLISLKDYYSNWEKARLGVVKYLSRPGQPSDEVAFITDSMTENELDSKLAGAEVLNVIKVTNY